MMTVKNMFSPRTNKPVANQFIIHDDETDVYTFQSYNSVCAEYDSKSRMLTLYDDFDYSTTTSKYCKSFIDYYTPFNASEIWKEAKKDNERVFFYVK